MDIEHLLLVGRALTLITRGLYSAFNPKQWSILGMVHQTVHRRQIEAIISTLEYQAQ